MQIRIATDEDQPAWDAYVHQHPNGVAYQLFAWLRSVEQAYGFSHRSLLAEEAGAVCGILPLIDFRVPLKGCRLVSLPYCDAGGVLADSDEVVAALLHSAEEQALAQKSVCEIRSVSDLRLEQPNQSDKVRMLLQLPDSSEQLLSGLKAKLRSQVKKPLRDGLTAKLGGAELIDQFYAVFAHNMRDLGSPVHSRSWIEAVVAYYAENCRVAVVYTPGGEPAAAGIVLLHSQTVSIPWASALRCYNRLNPNMLLYWTFLQFAADQGFANFDFGRSTPGEGTYRFKEQWGAEPQQLFWYQLPNLARKTEKPATAVNGVDPRELICNLWRKLPLTAANALGPYLRRYISL